MGDGVAGIGDSTGDGFGLTLDALKFHGGLVDGAACGGQFAGNAAALFLDLTHGDAGAGDGLGALADFVLADEQFGGHLAHFCFDLFLLFVKGGGVGFELCFAFSGGFDL